MKTENKISFPKSVGYELIQENIHNLFVNYQEMVFLARSQSSIIRAVSSACTRNSFNLNGK